MNTSDYPTSTPLGFQVVWVAEKFGPRFARYAPCHTGPGSQARYSDKTVFIRLWRYFRRLIYNYLIAYVLNILTVVAQVLILLLPQFQLLAILHLPPSSKFTSATVSVATEWLSSSFFPRKLTLCSCHFQLTTMITTDCTSTSKRQVTSLGTSINLVNSSLFMQTRLRNAFSETRCFIHQYPHF